MGRKRSYIFTNKKHSDRAVMAMILGVISTLSLVSIIYLAYVQEGKVPAGYGVSGLLIAVFSLTGLILGIVTAAEKDMYKLFPGLGIILNLIALIGIGLVVYAGLYL